MKDWFLIGEFSKITGLSLKALRTAILKSLWPEQYLNAIKKWEDKHQTIWQEFGYKKDKNVYYLKA